MNDPRKGLCSKTCRRQSSPCGAMGLWCLGSARMQVQSPAQHRGLRIRHCCSCGCGHNGGPDLIPGPGNSICLRAAKKERTEREKKKKTCRRKEGRVRFKPHFVGLQSPCSCNEMPPASLARRPEFRDIFIFPFLRLILQLGKQGQLG